MNFNRSEYSFLGTKIIKKILDIPPRPLGAYTLFVKDQFRNRSKDQDVQSYFRECAAKWKNISQSQRSVSNEYKYIISCTFCE